MLSIEEILKFHFSPTTFQQSAQTIIPISLTSFNEHRIDKLQKIRDKVGASSFTFLGDNLIPQVFRKFKAFINNRSITFERRELRTLTYSLNYSEEDLQSIFANENELRYALEFLESNWRDSFLVGLIDCFLKNWETKHQQSLEQLEQFITKKLDNYTGNRSALIAFKNNKRYFNTKNGDLILGDTVAKLNRPIHEATKILGVPESWINYAYFSRVIVTYYDRNKSTIEDEIDNLIDILQKHNNIITNKRLLSKVIIQINRPQLVLQQDKIKRIAFTEIGDPNNISNWAPFDHATEVEKNELLQGREILNEWITQLFINVFFEKCINNQRRKNFWLQYAPKVLSFKVYGSHYTKSKLMQDERIAEFVDTRFEVVSSYSELSAFILFIGQYMLVEFSNVGYAFYAYKIDSKYKPDLNRKLHSVDDLRNWAMPTIHPDSQYLQHNQEGRIAHRDGNQSWETKFSGWMNQMVLNDFNKY
jgi:hypothetical protein